MPDDQPKTFDVFLSHAHVDAEIVEKLGGRLIDKGGLRIWLDKWELVPGEQWQQGMAKALDDASSCAICIGNRTPAGWFRQEIQRALNRQTREPTFRVIPVILPGGDQSLVDNFLELRTWVQFKGDLEDSDALHRLICGIKGIPPGRGAIEQPWLEEHRQQLKVWDVVRGREFRTLEATPLEFGVWPLVVMEGLWYPLPLTRR